ncbi:hypothetical protein D3C76_1699370 [compost metagenome]
MGKICGIRRVVKAGAQPALQPAVVLYVELFDRGRSGHAEVSISVLMLISLIKSQQPP